MKAPSKNVSASLRSQGKRGRGMEEQSVTGMRSGGPTMTVPGEGGTSTPPGAGREHPMTGTAAVHAKSMSGHFGDKTS